jgi:Glycosyl transferases group 1/Glycosyl transferase family 2
MSMSSVNALFSDYRDRHRGETIIVCGCGVSLRQLRRPELFVTIGVNDVGRLFTPDYLIVVNERRQFKPDRYAYVATSQAKAVFSQLDLAHPRIVRFRLGKRAGTGRTEDGTLDYTNNSPYVAINLARYMGAARIGLIGVDFEDDHFFGPTGRHPLSGQLAQIDREYGALTATCRDEGIELVNLSPVSRLTSLPRASLDTWPASGGRIAARLEEPSVTISAARRIFFVHYRFLSCGTVFDTGLREAAATLGITAEHTDWDDAQLAQKVERFRPDLLFVVHGRRFVQRWGDRFSTWRSAVWLLDEPYEVDDTARWSEQFDLVLVNDAASLPRHPRAYALPVAYAPSLHYAPPVGERTRRVGFIGGANPARERLLGGLAQRGLLDYVVGGPWGDTRLNGLCLSGNVPAERTAALYRDTDIVVNVFRDRHHFNRDAIKGRALNPRIYEALACGALVISEPRDELARLVPELPTFRSEAEAAALIEHFIATPDERLRVQRVCRARLADATYAQRLRTVMDIALEHPNRASAEDMREMQVPMPSTVSGAIECERVVPFDDDWDDLGAVVRRASDGTIVIEATARRGPGAERGLTSRVRFDSIDLTFEACLESGACLLAKVHQADAIDQTSNSYHLHVDERRAYLARHYHIFRQFESPRLTWTRFRLVCCGGVLSLWRNDRLLHRVRDQALTGGYAFVGVQGGSVRVRQLRLAMTDDARARARAHDEVDELLAVATPPPRLSIVTTVYDRSDCLRRCIASVQRLRFTQFEHLIVADHPPADIMDSIRAIAASAGDPRIGLFNLARRFNNWGIAPAAAGLGRARGEYVAFLSDDNGYTPDHFDSLVRTLDRESSLGFVYSSCLYDGRLVLNHPVPRPGRIDLGQPLFRRELFELYFDDDLPFNVMSWDWHLIDALMRHGVRWRHVDRQSFIFRLAEYQQPDDDFDPARGVPLA